MLKVSLFGAGQACYEKTPLPGFPLQHPCLLLCYLLLNRYHPHQRDLLAGLFWSDCPNNLARKQLRNTLWRLRQYFLVTGANPDDYLLVCEDSVAFVNSSKYWLDIDIFESAIHHCRDMSGKELTLDQLRELETALDLYTGDLLEGVYADWCLYDRERLRMDYIHALGKLLAHHGLSGNYERGLHYGEKILAIDNTRERIHQQMMWLHFLAGDRNAALRQYKRCQQILRDELDVAPMDETRRLWEMIARSPIRSQNSFIKPKETNPYEAAHSHSEEPFTRRALEKLHYLQMMVDHASAELRLLERMIYSTRGEPESMEELEAPS